MVDCDVGLTLLVNAHDAGRRGHCPRPHQRALLIGTGADSPKAVVEAMAYGVIDDVIFLLKFPLLMVYNGSHPQLMNMAPVVGVVNHDLINVRC
jgi:hypothetical protein